eukprot:m.138277 g.138277  ORF g.138277 m.138277 type:complete len:113 (+) comp13998_c0_seq1:95-433(+)
MPSCRTRTFMERFLRLYDYGRWTVGSGNCESLPLTGIPELVKECEECEAKFSMCQDVTAQPFAEWRAGLSFHYYGIGEDLFTAIEASGLRETSSNLVELAEWLLSHTEDVFK